MAVTNLTRMSHSGNMKACAVGVGCQAAGGRGKPRAWRHQYRGIGPARSLRLPGIGRGPLRRWRRRRLGYDLSILLSVTASARSESRPDRRHDRRSHPAAAQGGVLRKLAPVFDSLTWQLERRGIVTVTT